MILPAKIEDAPTLSNLVNSAYRGDSSRSGWTTEADLLDGTRTDENAIREFFMESGSTILKYMNEGKIIGCVRLLKHGSQLYLGMFAVDPTEQNKGVGKKILLAAEVEARKQNCKSIDMTVISERTELIDWYKRNGYVQVGEKKPMVFDNPSGGIPKKDLFFITLEKFFVLPLDEILKSCRINLKKWCAPLNCLIKMLEKNICVVVLQRNILQKDQKLIDKL